jgi:hypothetical protein
MNDKTDDKEIDFDISMEGKMKELAEAKKNTQTLLDNAEASVNFHGLEYWAGRVEKLRNEIKNLL